MSDKEKQKKPNGEPKHNGKVEELKQKVAELEAKLEESQNKLSSALSLAREYKVDMERIRQRSKDVENEKTKEVAKKAVQELLPIQDNLSLAIGACEDEKVQKGFALIGTQFADVLAKMGAQKIDTSGEFNPEYHEAISTLPAPSADQENKIAHVLKAGYTMFGSVVRPAQVIVFTAASFES